MDLADLGQLARACLAEDGGLPTLAEEPLLRARLLRARTLGLRRSDDTSLVAAAGLDRVEGRATSSGLVHPAMRRRGIGERLLRWTMVEAAEAALLVETETWSAEAEALYHRWGLVRIFAEAVMRHDLADVVPVGSAPPGVHVVPAGQASGLELFAAYRGSFADRPGFVQTDSEEWLTPLRADLDWRRDLSLLALDQDGEPIAFVTVVGRWLDQVGVIPAWRGRGLGRFLVASTVRSLAAERAGEVWLCVNLNNPARELYQRLGFLTYGTRARYLRPAPSASPP
jgi:mycothiol synthase